MIRFVNYSVDIKQIQKNVYLPNNENPSSLRLFILELQNTIYLDGVNGKNKQQKGSGKMLDKILVKFFIRIHDV